MRQHAPEAKKEARAANAAEGERSVLTKIPEMPDADRALPDRLHTIAQAYAPGLVPRTGYGVPAYAQNVHVACLFQSTHTFKRADATRGCSDDAHLDAGGPWSTVYGLTRLTETDEAQIAPLIRRAVTSPGAKPA